MAVKSVGVLGCGLMGSGIAQVCAASGYKTVVREVEQSFLTKGLERIDTFLAGGVAKGKLTAGEKDRTLGNLSGTTNLEDLKDCDLIVEAIIENVEEKAKAYAILDGVLREHAIMCSNTSSLCITELAARTTRPDRFAGLHFFNPVPLMKLVEVVRGLTTSDETYRTVFAFAQSLGKEPVTAPDKPGFIVNRLLVPYLLDAFLPGAQRLGEGDVLPVAIERVGSRHLRAEERGPRKSAREERHGEDGIRDVAGPADPALQLARDQAAREDEAHRYGGQRHHEQQPAGPMEQEPARQEDVKDHPQQRVGDAQQPRSGAAEEHRAAAVLHEADLGAGQPAGQHALMSVQRRRGRRGAERQRDTDQIKH